MEGDNGSGNGQYIFIFLNYNSNCFHSESSIYDHLKVIKYFTVILEKSVQ